MLSACFAVATDVIVVLPNQSIELKTVLGASSSRMLVSKSTFAWALTWPSVSQSFSAFASATVPAVVSTSPSVFYGLVCLRLIIN